MTTLSDPQYTTQSLTTEEYREYEFCGYNAEEVRVYRITNPQSLTYRRGGSTHRIVDADGVVHLLPGPGFRGCVIRWKSKPGHDPVLF